MSLTQMLKFCVVHSLNFTVSTEGFNSSLLFDFARVRAVHNLNFTVSTKRVCSPDRGCVSCTIKALRAYRDSLPQLFSFH